MSIDALPPELYSAILLHVPSYFLQQTALSLTRAVPYSPVPLRHLFHSVRIAYPDQAIRLYNRLRSNSPHKHNDSDLASSWICRFSIETWTVDAEVVVSLVGLLQNLEFLSLRIGPTNFAPEHLEEIFSKYMPSLKYLSLRFRPYRDKANYFQFHKGAYFDSTLSALSAWPSSSSPHGLPAISIVQDPFSDCKTGNKRFAQPIIFHQFDHSLSQFIHSPLVSLSLKYLRVQFPARRTIQPLITSYKHAASPPPSIEFLDLSRCSITDSDIDALLVRFENLKHLVLDYCVIVGDRRMMSEDLTWWTTLGNRCALAGVQRARIREKTLKAWLEARSSNNSSIGDQDSDLSVFPEARRPRPGRRGLATATVSLRASTPPPGPSTAVNQSPQHRTRVGLPPKVHIIPSPPSLLSLSASPLTALGGSVGFSAETRASVISAFRNGWEDGLRVLSECRSRFSTTFFRRTALGQNIRFLKFKDGSGDEEGFEGLEDVTAGDEGAFFEDVSRDGSPITRDPPILCLSRLSMHEDEDHVDGCGHSVASGIWI